MRIPPCFNCNTVDYIFRIKKIKDTLKDTQSGVRFCSVCFPPMRRGIVGELKETHPCSALLVCVVGDDRTLKRLIAKFDQITVQRGSINQLARQIFTWSGTAPWKVGNCLPDHEIVHCIKSDSNTEHKSIWLEAGPD